MTPELLAPAGGPGALKAAVTYGADAVYFGVGSFHARQGAENFQVEELGEIASYCHKNQCKAYLTLNTLVSDRELPEAEHLLRLASRGGIDGVIVQDLGVASLCRQVVPDLPLHGSTQMTVSDIEGVRALEKLGFCRVVLPRELSKEEIRAIAQKTDMELEIFVHGALCMSYSGQCLMSSFIGGRSGNRGRCAQPCRLVYHNGTEKGTLLSPKDLCLLEHLEELKEMGIASLKLEGRMKGADYVAAVVSAYRRCLDGKRVTKEDIEQVESVFYRGGLTDGYFTARKKGMICPDKPQNPYTRQKELKAEPYERKVPMEGECRIRIGEPLSLTLGEVTYQGEILAERARERGLSCERIREQIEKTGGTPFVLKELEIDLEEGAILPVSELNRGRRYCLEGLEEKLFAPPLRREGEKASYPAFRREYNDFFYTAEAWTREQYEALKEVEEIKVWYLPFDCEDPRGVKILPVVGGYERGDMPSAAARLGQAEHCKVGNGTLNIFNSLAAEEYRKMGLERLTLSPELTLAQISGIGGEIEVVGYGRTTLMTMENCVMKCQKGGTLTDRTGEEFPVRCLPGCRNEILNSKPVYMGDKGEDLRRAGVTAVRLRFTTETPEECVRVWERFKKELPPEGSFTRGKFYKGV